MSGPVDESVRNAVAAATGQCVVDAEPLAGGCIAPVYRLRLGDGASIVAKLGHGGNGLALEAFMLDYLKRNTALPVPAVLHVSPDLLLLDYIDHEPGVLDEAAERHLGTLVAELHGITAPHYGFPRDTVIGPLPQPNPESDDWRTFFAEHRLRYMAGRAHAAGRLPAATLARVEALAGRLTRWIDVATPPTLLHGDLWGGNILGRRGRIVGLIDPAIYHGEPEIELAFMTLFGSVGGPFFASYGERRPIRPGFFEARRDLYNLYPLLVHVFVFGGPSLQAVERTLARFGC